MTTYRVTFEIQTDADPSTVLHAAVEICPDLAEAVEAYGEDVLIDDATVCVEEVADAP